MLPSLNNRFCKPRVIFVGLEIGNTRQRGLFSFLLSSLSAGENCDVASENETTVTGKRAEDEGRAAKKRKTDKKGETDWRTTNEGWTKKDRERVAQWNVYCPRCGPLAGYIRAHPPFGGYAIK